MDASGETATFRAQCLAAFASTVPADFGDHQGLSNPTNDRDQGCRACRRDPFVHVDESTSPGTHGDKRPSRTSTRWQTPDAEAALVVQMLRSATSFVPRSSE